MNETYTILKTIDERIDALEVELIKNESDYELAHTFTPGLYSREIGMQAGDLVVSKIHKTTHQFCLLKGTVAVKVNDENWEYFSAPFIGITKAGTRRVLYIIESASWITFHPTDKETPEEVENDIIEPRVNSVLGIDIQKLKGSLKRDFDLIY